MTYFGEGEDVRLSSGEYRNAARILIAQPNWTVGVRIGEIRNGHARLELPFEFDLTKEFSIILEDLRTLVECCLASQNGRFARIRLLSAPRPVSLHKYRPLREKAGLQVPAGLLETG